VLKRILISLPLFLIAAVVLFNPLFVSIVDLLTDCHVYANVGILCPGCGNTRAALAILNFRIIQSLRYNISLAFALCIALLFYLQLVLAALSKRIRLVPNNAIFWYSTLAIFVLYFVFRNVL